MKFKTTCVQKRLTLSNHILQAGHDVVVDLPPMPFVVNHDYNKLFLVAEDNILATELEVTGAGDTRVRSQGSWKTLKKRKIIHLKIDCTKRARHYLYQNLRLFGFKNDLPLLECKMWKDWWSAPMISLHRACLSGSLGSGRLVDERTGVAGDS